MKRVQTLSPINTPLTFFLIGATGDLAKKKIWRAIYELYKLQLLPSEWRVVGIARTKYSQAKFIEFLTEVVQPQNTALWKAFCNHVIYHSGDVSQKETFQRLARSHAKFESCGNHLWYLATLPSLYLPIITALRSTGLAASTCGWSKLLLEKPFGTDLQTAQNLNTELSKTFTEDEIFRIDHFLAKETVQNILVFRFANGIFENIWNSNFVDHIQIHTVEKLGVGGREAFFDATGAVRDVVQNHALQMIATTLMEEPTSLHSKAIRRQRYDLLSKLTLADPKQPLNSAIFGQYRSGVIDGAEVKGYLDERGMPADSLTETAAVVKLVVHNKRWSGVPIYVKAGKRLDRTVTEISIQFKEKRNRMFSRQSAQQQPNVLTFRIGPDESVKILLSAKKPGIELGFQEVPLQFSYRNEFQMELVEAYVKLLHDAIRGDSTLFSHAKDIEEAWRIIDPLLAHKRALANRIATYAAGTAGPTEFAEFIEKDGRRWL